jgi:aminopeptidase N
MKAPEFVRMIETLMGKEMFVQGLDLYHQRYRHGNATRDQWLQAMEEVSGQQFTPMADTWLKQTGFPTHVKTSYDNNRHVTVLSYGRKETARKNAGSSGKHRGGRYSGRDVSEILYG